MDDLSRFCSQNFRCPDAGCRGVGNLTVTGRRGKHKPYRLLDCRTWQARLSERKSTPLSRAHLPEAKVLSLLHHIAEGCGVLKTARLVDVHPDTVLHSSRVAGGLPRASTTSGGPTRPRPANSRGMRRGRASSRRRRTAMRTTPTIDSGESGETM
jgi:hypothetical protein